MMRRYALAGAVLALSGCTTMQQVTTDVREDNQAALLRAETALQRGPITPVRGPVVTDLPYVDVRPVPAKQAYPLVFQRDVRFEEPVGVSIQVLAQRIEALTGLRVTYQAELVSQAEAAPPAAAQQTAAPQVSLENLPPLPAIAQVPGAMQLGGAPTPDIRTGVALSYHGPVKGLLDAVAAATGAYWRYDDAAKRVDFYRYLTETFRIATPPGTPKSVMAIGNKQGGSGQQLAAGQAALEHTTEGSVWKEMEAAIGKMLSSEGALVVNENLGTITVRDRPDRIEQVRTYIDAQNKALAREVDFDVAIYRVWMDDADVRGLNWSLFFQKFIENSPYSLYWNTLNMAPNDPGAAQTILRAKETVEGVPTRYGGSSLVWDALSQLGKASVVTTVRVHTTNNTPAPVRLTRRVAYLAQTSQAVAGGGAGGVVSSGTQLTPGEVETGLIMSLLPHVQDDGKRVLVRGMASLSTLERLDEYTSGEQTIQLPQLAAREFQLTSWLASGETLVMVGFDQVDSGLTSSSPFDARAWVLAGKREARRKREVVVLTLTPVVRHAPSAI